VRRQRPHTFYKFRLTDGDETVSLTRRPRLFPSTQEDSGGTDFFQSMSKIQGQSAAGRIMPTEK
jgi:hypothetical protein